MYVLPLSVLYPISSLVNVYLTADLCPYFKIKFVLLINTLTHLESLFHASLNVLIIGTIDRVSLWQMLSLSAANSDRVENKQTGTLYKSRGSNWSWYQKKLTKLSFEMIIKSNFIHTKTIKRIFGTELLRNFGIRLFSWTSQDSVWKKITTIEAHSSKSAVFQP